MIKRLRGSSPEWLEEKWEHMQSNKAKSVNHVRAFLGFDWAASLLVQGAEPPSLKPKLYVQAQGRSGRDLVRVFLGPEWLSPLFAAHEKPGRPIESEKHSYVVY